MHRASLKALAICSLLYPTLALAQEKPPALEPPHCRLTFRLMQANADGKIVNTRTYSIIIAAAESERPQSIRTGDRIPAGGNDYVNVGTNIDTNNEQLVDHSLRLRVDVQSSTALKGDSSSNALPVIRQTTWGSQVVVTLDKPTIIFTADNISDTGKTELELTATEIKQP